MRNPKIHVLGLLILWFNWYVVAEEQASEITVAADQPFAEVTKVITDHVDQGRIAGAVTMISQNGELVYESSIGTTGIDEETPLEKDALFRIYSMSKPISAVALMQLYDAGEFKLDDPISKYIPEFNNLTVHNVEGDSQPVQTRPTFKHILTHTAGFGYVFDLRHPVEQEYRAKQVMGAKDLEEFATRLEGIPLRTEPGAAWHYSIASDITGLLVERISGQSFDVYFKENIFEPLGMNNTFFSVPEEKWDRFLPNHSWSRQDEVLRQHPPRASESFRNVTFFSGGGGLVSTAMDYMKFAQAVAAGGELNGKRILKSSTVGLMRQDHLPTTLQAFGSGEAPGQGENENRFGFGLGFGVSPNGQYSWGGAAGTIFWIDPMDGTVVVCMIQVMGFPPRLRDDLQKAITEAPGTA